MAHDLRILADKLRNLKKLADEFVLGCKTINTSHSSSFDWIASRMHGIYYAVFEAESNGIPREKILEVLQGVRLIQSESPFIARLQNWNRGYQGDFETIEYLLSSQNKAKPKTIGFWIEKYCLNTAITQQHRNKVGFQADRILQTILAGLKKEEPAKILILACGSSPDLQIILDLIEPLEYLIVLNDMDQAALAFSAQKLSPIRDRVEICPGNTFRLINRFAEFGGFDLVLAGGLFDYLQDHQATFLINAIHTKLLAPGGSFIFTNIAEENPYKYWMEYCANWFLIERTETEIKQLLENCRISPENISIRPEATGLTYLVETEKYCPQNFTLLT
jgi:extracellular factor (EF) 3-hydroxypalmitic acid methyl ester biosynthesis protein